MQTHDIHAAKTHLSQLVDAVAEGETIIITKGGIPVAKLVRITALKRRVAAQLLSQTDIGVSELAMKIGYKSENSFVRAFKHSRGMTPNQHRFAGRRADASHGEACGLPGQLLACL